MQAQLQHTCGSHQTGQIEKVSHLELGAKRRRTNRLTFTCLLFRPIPFPRDFNAAALQNRENVETHIPIRPSIRRWNCFNLGMNEANSSWLVVRSRARLPLLRESRRIKACGDWSAADKRASRTHAHRQTPSARSVSRRRGCVHVCNRDVKLFVVVVRRPIPLYVVLLLFNYCSDVVGVRGLELVPCREKGRELWCLRAVASETCHTSRRVAAMISAAPMRLRCSRTRATGRTRRGPRRTSRRRRAALSTSLSRRYIT